MYVVRTLYTKTSSSSSSASVVEERLYDPRYFDEGYIISDAIVTFETNKAGSFTFTMPPSNPRYNDLVKLKTLVYVYEYTDETYTSRETIWKGRVLEEEIDFYLNKKVTCEGELAFLNDIMTQVYDVSATIKDYITYMVATYNLRCTADRQITMGDVVIYEADANDESDTANTYSTFSFANEDVSDVSSELSEKIIDEFGGYFEVVNGVLNYYSDYNGSLIVKKDYKTARYGQDKLPSYFFDSSGNVVVPDGWTSEYDAENKQTEYINNNVSTQTINFGENLVDLTQTLVAEDIYTCLLPLGREKDTTSSNDDRSYRVFLNDRLTVGYSDGNEHDREADGTINGLTCYKLRDSKAYEEYGDDIVRIPFAYYKFVSGSTYEADENGDNAPTVTTSGPKIILASRSGVKKYGMIFKTLTYDKAKSDGVLERRGCYSLSNALNQTITIELSAVDLHLLDVDTERLKINQYVRVISKPHNIDEYFLCTKIELNLSDPGESTYTFGDSIKGITD